MKLSGLKSVENAHDDSIWACAWVPATENRPALLLTGSLDETVRLWRPDALEPFWPSPSTGHCLGVVSVAAHPSGAVAASASLDSFVRVFDVDTNATISTLEAPPSEVWGMQFDPKVRVLNFSAPREVSLVLHKQRARINSLNSPIIRFCSRNISARAQ